MDKCKGSSYKYAIGDKHFFIFISELTPSVCYYCNTKEGEDER